MGLWMIRLSQCFCRKVPGQKALDVVSGNGLGKLGKDMGKVLVGFNSVRTSGYHKTVEGGAGFGPIHGIGKKPGSSAKGERSYGVFDKIRIKPDHRIIEKANEFRPLTVHVGQRLTCEGLWRNLIQSSVQPCSEVGYHLP